MKVILSGLTESSVYLGFSEVKKPTATKPLKPALKKKGHTSFVSLSIYDCFQS